MNDHIDDLEGRVATALRAVADAVPDGPPRSFSDERARREHSRHQRHRRAHRHKTLRRAVIVGMGTVVVCGAVLGGLAWSTSSGDPTPGSPAERAAAPTPRVIRYQVAGYTTAQATTATATCLSAAGAKGVQGAALRATFSDASGSTLVVTTPSGWYTCKQSADGTVFTNDAFESYAQAQGWASGAARAAAAAAAKAKGTPVPTFPTPPPGDLSAHWLTSPVELDSEGGGYYSKSTIADGWLDVALGRVAPGVTKVTVQMPGGSIVTASVENGFFVARQLLPSPPTMPARTAPVTVPIMGYDSSGKLVYDSLTSPSAPPAYSPPTWEPQCFVTPSGQPVTPTVTSGQKCRTATAW